MNLIKVLKRTQQETGLSSLFPITHLNSPSIFESKEGFLGATLRVQGAPFEMAESTYLNQMNYRLHQAMLGLDARFIQYVTIHRHKEDICLKGAFKSLFAKQVDAKYHARFAGQSLYRNDIYITLVLKGDDSSRSARSLSFLERLKVGKNQEGKKKAHDEQLKILLNKLEQLKTSLSAFKPYLLGDADNERGYSELLRFLSLVPNGGESIPIKYVQTYPVISKNLAKVIPEELLYPDGHLGQYLCNKQVFFGTNIQFQGATSSDKHFGAMLSLKQYNQETGSVILDPLLGLDSEFILTHTFASIPRDIALDVIAKKRGKLLSAKDLGASQIQALSQLEDGIASDNVRMGYHHNSLMLLGESIDAIEKATREAVKAYAYSGMAIVKETLGAEPAFWAQIPGNHALICRARLITSHNFVDFCALHNYETGFRDGNHLGDAITLLETPSKTPIYFNYHGKSSKTNPARGHTAIYGATNAGKNTLVAFLDAQMGRYNNRSFFLDRDEASKIYVLASGSSSYTVISPTHGESLKMNPMQLPDTPENRTFVKDWFGQLIKHPNEEDLPSELTETISECVNYSFDQLEKPYRCLSHATRFLPHDFPRWAELRRWLKGDGKFEDGDYHWLFDNQTDALDFDFDKVGFDITYLMDEVSNLISTPVYMYLLHRMRQCLDGRLTSFIIDEAWQVLGSAFWRKHLKSWLATIRKKNGHFIFMTQSPETVVNSVIASEILTNVATSIYFPNPAANEVIYKKGLSLSEAEYQTIKKLTPESRMFLYKQDNQSLLCKLDLSALRDEIRVFSGNQQSVRLLDAILREVGSNPSDWLPVFLKRSAA